jgi:hypothetical protein
MICEAAYQGLHRMDCIKSVLEERVRDMTEKGPEETSYICNIVFQHPVAFDYHLVFSTIL